MALRRWRRSRRHDPAVAGSAGTAAGASRVAGDPRPGGDGARRWRLDEPPGQIRVHGVGGPQATRMLGLLHDEDTVPVPQAHLPPVAQGSAATRFVRGVPDDGVEAYEWGGLTTGSWAKGLWVLYLPFTLLNAAGWAHPAPRPDRGHPRGPRVYRLCAHVAAGLATVTYVVWTAYILLDLVATRWVDHVTCRTAPEDLACRPEVTGIARDAAEVWVPIVVPFLFLGLVGVVFGAPVLRHARPTRPTDDPADDPTDDEAGPIAGAGFFARDEGRLRAAHTAVVAAVALGAVGLHLAGWDRLGLLVIVTAVAQTLVIAVMGVSDLAGRLRHRWYDGPGMPPLPDGLWEPRWAPPVGVALAAIGTALTHSAFSGAARLLRGFLAGWPEESPVTVIEAHAELGAADVLGAMLALAVVGVLLTLGHVADRPPAERRYPVVALARRAHLLGTWLLVAVAVPVTVYAVLNRSAFWPDGSTWPDPTWGHLEDWYDGYSPDRSSILTSIGSVVATALPIAVFAVLRGSHRTGLGRVIGNVWDVLTFWPRRFHPFAVPAASERAVPELRARIAQAADGRTADDPLVVAAHSQGSVLAVAALAGMEELPGAVRLVTFGSPLGTLYAPTWPAYVAPALVAARARLDAAGASGEPWVSFSRPTDPVGAGVPLAANVVLEDPREPTEEERTEDMALRRPIDRPRWGVSEGHSRYLSDPHVRRALARPWTDERR